MQPLSRIGFRICHISWRKGRDADEKERRQQEKRAMLYQGVRHSSFLLMKIETIGRYFAPKSWLPARVFIRAIGECPSPCQGFPAPGVSRGGQRHSGLDHRI